MKHCPARTTQTSSRRRWITSIAALAGACLALLPPGLYAHDLTPPPVPTGLEVPEGHRPFLRGYASGTQNYICLPLPDGSGFDWAFFGPQATLFNDDALQIITHFLSPNPDEGGMARATWQHSRDTSTVWAMPIMSSTDPDFVEPDAIPWLLLEVVGADRGPTGGAPAHGDRLSAAGAHLGRHQAHHRLYRSRTCCQQGVGAVYRRLRLLQSQQA